MLGSFISMAICAAAYYIAERHVSMTDAEIRAEEDERISKMSYIEYIERLDDEMYGPYFGGRRDPDLVRIEKRRNNK